MIGGGRWLMPLVLALILGVLGMHALVLTPAGPVHGEPVTSPVVMAPTAGAESPGHDAAGRHDASSVTPGAEAVADRSGAAAGHGSMPSMHQLVHLCLAILAALLVLGVAALKLWPTQWPDRPGGSIGELVRRAPRRRPPPTSVRLAQLCVLRN